MENEKDWCVECWGSFADNYGTDIFDTEVEAKNYFNSISKDLDPKRYTITEDSIVDNEDSTNSVNLTNLSELT